MNSLQEPILPTIDSHVNTDEVPIVTSQLPELNLPEATTSHEEISTNTSLMDTVYTETSLVPANVSAPPTAPGPIITISPILSDMDHPQQLTSNIDKEPTQKLVSDTFHSNNKLDKDYESSEIELPKDICRNNQAIKTVVYYSILTVEQDDIIQLHHNDIVNHTCIVKVDKLSQTDVKHAIAALHHLAPPSTLQSDEPKTAKKESDLDWPNKKHKKKST